MKMVDTIRCVDERNLTPAFYLKLLTGAIDRFEDNQAQGNDLVQGQSRYTQESKDRPKQPQHSSHDSNDSESSARTWSASRVPTSGFANSDPVDSMANHFQGLDILDENYTYSPASASATATNSRFPSARRNHTPPSVHPPPAPNHQYVAAQVQDQYSLFNLPPPRANTVPGGAPGPSSAILAQPKQGSKHRFSWLHHRDGKS